MSAIDTVTARAAAIGSSQAENEFHGGATAPVDSPLSGEWAGDLTPADLHEKVGIKSWDEVLCDAAESAYEDAYFGTWQALLGEPC